MPQPPKGTGSETPTHNTVTEEIRIGYYGKKPYKIILDNISEDTRLILGDLGHFGRYGIAIAREAPGASVSLYELLREGEAGESRAKEAAKYIANAGIDNVKVVTCISALPFVDGSFDFVYSFEIENFADYVPVFKELLRVLRPGGRILIGVPNYYNPFHTLRKYLLKRKGLVPENGYEKSFRHSELRTLFKDNGISSVTIKGVAPIHSLMRLSRVSKYKKLLQFIKWWSLMRFIDITFINFIDFLTKGFISDKLGFEIIAAGTKPQKQNTGD